MQTNTTIGAEVVLLRTSKEFHAGRTSPTMTRIITNRRSSEDIDAATVRVVLMAKEIVFVGNDAEDGYLL